MAVVIVQGGNNQQLVNWHTGLFDCCAAPGGIGTCCYVMYCPCCAAGDIATAAGQDYCMSCCVCPFLGPICMYCKWGNDRAMLAQKYGVAGASGGCNGYLLMCCCATCALIQELNHIKANASKPLHGNTQVIVTQQPQMVMQQGYAPQPMGYAPQQQGYPQQQQQQYPPRY